MRLVTLAAAPILICTVYIYIRDKYEKEPIWLLITGICYGAFITVPIVHSENFMMLFVPLGGIILEAFYLSFFVASLVEEGFKFIILFFLIWKNNNFNERFDGIVYAVFISLGFAGLENFLYVFNPEIGGLETAISRAIFSVPGHAFFGVTMGYYFALMKFEEEKKLKYTSLAFLVPWILHGLYDFILMINVSFIIFFIPFFIYLWFLGFKKMKRLVELSPFK